MKVLPGPKGEPTRAEFEIRSQALQQLLMDTIDASGEDVCMVLAAMMSLILRVAGHNDLAEPLVGVLRQNADGIENALQGKPLPDGTTIQLH